MSTEKKTYALRLFKKYPDKIPVIMKKDPKTTIPSIDKEKFLVPKDLTVAQFIYMFRQRIKLSPEQAIYLFFNGKMVNTTETMQNIYDQHHSKEDDMLYCTYAAESTFG